MAIYVSGQVVFTLSVYVIAKNLVGRIRIYVNKEQIRSILVFSIPIGLASVVGTLSYSLDQLVIGTYFGTEQLAIYTNAGRVK